MYICGCGCHSLKIAAAVDVDVTDLSVTAYVEEKADAKCSRLSLFWNTFNIITELEINALSENLLANVGSKMQKLGLNHPFWEFGGGDEILSVSDLFYQKYATAC